MKHNVFGYICYSLLTACLLYPHDSFAYNKYIKQMVDTGETVDDAEYITCSDFLNEHFAGCYDEGGSYSSPVSRICRDKDYINSYSENCRSHGNLWYIGVSEDTGSSFCSYDSNSKLLMAPTCNTCESSVWGGIPVKKASLWQVCRMMRNNGLTDDDIGYLANDLINAYNACDGESDTDSDFYVCVRCPVSNTTYGNWVSVDSWVVRRSVTKDNKCGDTTSEYEYKCKANTYYVTGSGAQTICKPCPDNAECNTNNGHLSTFTCKEGYSIEGGDWCVKNGCEAGKYMYHNECEPCPRGTYQPNYGNTGGSDSCRVCPPHTDQPSNGSSVIGDTNDTGNDSVSDCFIGGTYTDSTGTYDFNGDVCGYFEPS